MIIDAHNHPDWIGLTFREMIKNMDQYGIDQTWLLSWELPKNEWDPNLTMMFRPPTEPGPFTLDRVLAFCEQEPTRFIPGYAPDPRRPDGLEKLRGAVNNVGVKVCGEVKLRCMYDNPDCLRMFRYCGEAGLPVILHLDYDYPGTAQFPRSSYWYGGGIDTLERVLKLCPHTNFLGHAPGFWAHISADDKYKTEAYPTGEIVPGGEICRLLETCPNLYCDISGGSGSNALGRDHTFARNFITDFAERIVFARDYNSNGHRELLDRLDLDKAVLEKVYWKNAKKLLQAS